MILIRFRKNLQKNIFFENFEKNWKKSTYGAQNFRIEKNKNKKLSDTK